MRTKNLIEDFDADVITTAQLAQRFGVDPTVCRKWLKKNHFKFCFVRREETGNQLTAALNREDVAAAIKLRKIQGFKVS